MYVHVLLQLVIVKSVKVHQIFSLDQGLISCNRKGRPILTIMVKIFLIGVGGSGKSTIAESLTKVRDYYILIYVIISFTKKHVKSQVEKSLK